MNHHARGGPATISDACRIDAKCAVLEHDMGPVLDFGARTLPGEIADDRVGQAEELQRLIDQVRPEIHPQAGAGSGPFAPAVAHGRPISIEMRLEERQNAERPAANDDLRAEKIAVPAAIVEHGQQPSPSVARAATARASSIVSVNGFSTTTCRP